MHDYVRALLGGALIGVAASMLLLFNGRIAGISGIVGGLLRPAGRAIGWRAAFVGGLAVGGVVLALAWPSTIAAPTGRGFAVIAVAGLLVGIGVRMGSGCTSGHGVCGIGRASPRSVVATLTFMATGMLIASLFGRVFGGAS